MVAARKGDRMIIDFNYDNRDRKTFEFTNEPNPEKDAEFQAYHSSLPPGTKSRVTVYSGDKVEKFYSTASRRKN